MCFIQKLGKLQCTFYIAWVFPSIFLWARRVVGNQRSTLDFITLRGW
jgi:hypothetical protein